MLGPRCRGRVEGPRVTRRGRLPCCALPCRVLPCLVLPCLALPCFIVAPYLALQPACGRVKRAPSERSSSLSLSLSRVRSRTTRYEGVYLWKKKKTIFLHTRGIRALVVVSRSVRRHAKVKASFDDIIEISHSFYNAIK